MLTRSYESRKNKVQTAIAGTFATLAVLLLSGCVNTKVQSQSFRVSQDSTVESAQIATDADFSRYNELLATELGIFFPKSQTTTAADLKRIRQIFREAFLAQLEGYSIVSEVSPSTMTVEASLVDLRNAGGREIPNMRSDIRDIAVPGSILFLMEMRDSQSDRVLARAADSAKTPTFSNAVGAETDWTSIEEAAQHWAALFKIFLDENFAH
jgi:hypothetical protein